MLETHTIFDDDASGKAAPTRRVTNIKEAVRDQNRVNIYVDDKFFCSLDISQVVDFGVKIGRELSGAELEELRRASNFGKFYTRALEYVLIRPHSSKEIRDYLKRKTLNKKVRTKNPKTGEYQTKVREGYDSNLIPLVLERLDRHGYLDDERFARIWVENRHTKKGISNKKLQRELAEKGISKEIIESVLRNGARDEREELRKVIARKINRYPDQQKLMQYLLRQGFNYSDISEELSTFSSDGA